MRAIVVRLHMKVWYRIKKGGKPDYERVEDRLAMTEMEVPLRGYSIRTSHVGMRLEPIGGESEVAEYARNDVFYSSCNMAECNCNFFKYRESLSWTILGYQGAKRPPSNSKRAGCR